MLKPLAVWRGTMTIHRRAAGLAAGILVVSASLFAHHSQVGWDLKNPVTHEATITQFEFVNPHSIIHYIAKDENGQVVQWIAEGSPPNNLRRQGWTKYTLKPGDQVTLKVHLSKSGVKEVHLWKVIREGKEIFTSSRGE